MVKLLEGNLFIYLLILCVWPAAGFAEGVLFQENFEDTNFASRGWYDITGGVLSTIEHIPGSTKSLECRFLKGQTSPSGGIPKRHLFQETDSVYVGYWIKYSSNWQGQPAAYDHHEFYILTNANDVWSGLAWTKLTAYIEQNHGIPTLTIQDGENIDTSKIGVDLRSITEMRAVAGCNGDSDGYGKGECYQCGSDYCNAKDWKAKNVYFSDNPGSYYKSEWHYVEAYFKLNSVVNGKGIADGKIKYWYDGQLIIDINNAVLRTAQYPNMKFNQFIIAPFLGDGSPVDQTFWVDDLILASSRPNDYIAPRAPTGLRILQ